MPVHATLRDDLKKFLLDVSLNQELAPPSCKTGVESVDQLTGGLPRGAITEIFGPPSSGRTSLMCSILAESTRNLEFCALVDSCDTFDPVTASASGVILEQLLWIRCGGIAENALKVADLLIQGGGFGVVAIDFANLAPGMVRRFPLSYWYRFRRAVENTPTVLLMLQNEPYVKACTSLALETRRTGVQWSGSHADFRLLRGASLEIGMRKPAHKETARSHVRALAG